MPTRKQRRRQQKERRHEYEYVYVDDEGHEVEVDDDDAPRPKNAKPARQGTGSRSSARPAAKGPSRGAPRTINPPSWQKVFRRAAIFAPFMFIVVYYLGKGNENHSIKGDVVSLVALVLFFIPFSYYMDVMMYRRYRKQIGDPLPPRAPRQKRS